MNGVLDYHACVVQPGYLVYSREPACIFGVCGNGVMVTVRDNELYSGGVALCVYPTPEVNETPSHFHADVALRSLLGMFLHDGTRGIERLEARIIGGAHHRGLNRARAEAVVRHLKVIFHRVGIEVVSQDTGGTVGRKVLFNTFSGETMTVRTSRIRRSDWVPEQLVQPRRID